MVDVYARPGVLALIWFLLELIVRIYLEAPLSTDFYRPISRSQAAQYQQAYGVQASLRAGLGRPPGRGELPDRTAKPLLDHPRAILQVLPRSVGDPGCSRSMAALHHSPRGVFLASGHLPILRPAGPAVHLHRPSLGLEQRAQRPLRLDRIAVCHAPPGPPSKPLLQTNETWSLGTAVSISGSSDWSAR